MKFLDSNGVRKLKEYVDNKFVTAEEFSVIEGVERDTYTKQEIDVMLAEIEGGGADLTDYYTKTESDSKYATPSQIPTKTSQLTNNSGFITSEADPVFTASAAAGITSSDITNWNNKTSNIGTITGITMNGSSKGTSGVIDLGTVITSHQDISGKADKSVAISSLGLSLDQSNYKLTLSGTKADGTTFTVSDVIDLPLESVVVGGSYNNTTKKVVLTLQNGNTIDFSVADLVSGLQTQITATNKLSADLISDGTTNKVVTATEKSTWNAKQDAISDIDTIRSNATAGAAKVSNVQSDWNATSGLSQILNKPTIPTVNNSTITIQKGGTTVDSFTTNGSAKTINIPNELPSYSSSDSGKILSVNSSGQLVWITPAHIYSGTSAPDANTGNNGDVYLQE